METSPSHAPSRRPYGVLEPPAHHHPHQHHRQNGNARGGNGFHRRNLPPIAVQPGQACLRVLCRAASIGAVIGRSGSVVKQLERDTGAAIRVDDAVPDCAERLVSVVGSAIVDRRVEIRGEDGGREECDVSQGQEALLMVYDRIFEAEARMMDGGGGGGVGGAGAFCRMLAGGRQIGALLGKGGRTVERIRIETGAKIKILPPEQIPACAAPGEELIQIMGSIMAVKKAVVFVSRCLQDSPPLDRAPMLVGGPTESPSYGSIPNPPAVFHPQYESSPSLPGTSLNYTPAGQSLSADFDKSTSTDSKNDQHEVVFRLLCSNGAAGGVIGKGGAIVRCLQNETGASISVAAPIAGENQRVVSVSALENKEMLFSPAQNAIVRVFMRTLEASVENGIMSSLNDGNIVSTMLLVTSKQVGYLFGEDGAVVSEIRKSTGAEIKVLGRDQIPSFAMEDDQLVQIVGGYDNVRRALYQMTGRLRDYLFPGHSRYIDQDSALAQGMNHLVLNPKIGGRSSKMQPSHVNQILPRWDTTAAIDGKRSFRGFRGGLKADDDCKSANMMSTTVEFLVSVDKIPSIYGEDGGNLVRLRQISGAKVEMNDPSPGESQGKVIISGTADQARAAQSLLQAFILTG